MELLYRSFVNATSQLNADSDLIKQAFINFYGDHNKSYIEEKLSNLRIVWYEDKEIDEVDDIKNHIVSSIPAEEMKELLSKRSKSAFLKSAYIDEFDLLVLPLSYDLTHIIHEFNHRVSSHILSYKPLILTDGISYIQERNVGLMIYDEFLNEAINQNMTLDILDELNNLGIKTKVTSSWQEHLFPLVNLFYDTFKDLLKETFISGDLSSFVSLVGEDNYNDFSQIIYLKGNKIRRQLRNGNIPEISQESIDVAEDIVHKMQLHYEAMNNNERKK